MLLGTEYVNWQQVDAQDGTKLLRVKMASWPRVKVNNFQPFAELLKLGKLIPPITHNNVGAYAIEDVWSDIWTTGIGDGGCGGY